MNSQQGKIYTKAGLSRSIQHTNQLISSRAGYSSSEPFILQPIAPLTPLAVSVVKNHKLTRSTKAWAD